MSEARPSLPDATFCDDAYEAAEGADAVLILTEWNQFRKLELDRLAELLDQPLVIDLRNVYEPADGGGGGLPLRLPRPPRGGAGKAAAEAIAGERA